MQKPTVLLLGANDELEADLRKALKDVANLVASDVPAELISEEVRRIRPGAAIVAVTPQTPQRSTTSPPPAAS